MTNTSPGNTVPVPLCIDLDGTLLQADSLHVSLRRLLLTRPWLGFLAPFWVLHGKAQFKRHVANSVDLPLQQLPFDARIIDYAQSAREGGQPVWLVSGCDESVARGIADYLGGFDGVLASNGEINLTGEHKRDALCERFGAHHYDYIGNSTADLPVWSRARHVLIANARPALVEQVGREHSIFHHFPRDGQ